MKTIGYDSRAEERMAVDAYVFNNQILSIPVNTPRGNGFLAHTAYILIIY